MDFAKKQTETAKAQLEAEFSNLDTLLKATPIDPEAIAHALQDVDAEIENYFARQDSYIELLFKNKKNDIYDAEEVERKAVRKRKSALLISISKACGVATASGSSSSSGAGSGATTMDNYRVKLPKRELAKFSGDVRQWRSFWASFQEVDSDKSIPAIGKYNYLLQCMVPGSSAAKVVSSFPPADTSYELAKKELENRFGRKKTLIKVFVRDLLALVVENAKEKKSDNFVDVVTKLQSQILNLAELGVTQDKYGELLYPIIESCIPVEVLNRYLDQPGVKEELPEIMEYLRNEVRRKEESARAQSAFGTSVKEESKHKGSDKHKDKQVIPTAAALMNASQKSRSKCGFCQGNHATIDCRKAISMTLEERREALKKSGTCYKCLRGQHHAKKCGSKILCVTCKKNHHVLMCFGGEPELRLDQLNFNPGNSEPNWRSSLDHAQQQYYSSQQQSPSSWTFGPGPSSSPSSNFKPSGGARSNDNMANYVRKPEVLMQTLLVQVYSPEGFTRIVRAMYDTGSQASYIKHSLAVELKMKAEGKELVVHQTFGGAISKQVEHPVVRMKISGVADPYLNTFTFQTSVVKQIATNIIGVPNGPWIQECVQAKIPLTDVVDISSEIQVLIGNDVAPYLKVQQQSLRLQSGLIASETRLGWFLEGKIPGTENKKSTHGMMCVNMMVTDKEIQSYWALETIGIRDASENRTRAELEEAALSHFMETVEREEDGRYKVHMPFIEGHPSLPTNKNQAYARLEKTTKDLVRDEKLEQYDAIFKDWESEGIIERVPALVHQQPSNILHYLGHRAVYKEGSTTPVRPVYNASGKTKLNPSLNDCLEKGPNLLEIIPSILSRFRMEKIGVISDIRKAFLQLKVTEEHRDCLRFLWWEEIVDRKRVVEYRHCRVVFGVSSSPFLLGAVIQHLLKENEEKFPDTVVKLNSSFYVDNCVASLPTLEDVVKFKEEAQEIFTSAQMDLRGWEFGPSSEEKSVPVLGLLWNTHQDCLSYDLKNIMKKIDTGAACTRRTVLQLANSLYDPLGLLSPFVIVIKIIFKRVCRDDRKFGWDEELPEEFAKEINVWKNQLQSLSQLSIPRCITGGGGSSREMWSLHVMSDASKESYACCIYLRIEGNPVQVQLVQARTRVTPMTVLTIPRAELLGCLIAARLYNQVKEDIGVADIPVTFWSDSSTAITWKKKTDAVWGVFVNRRVEEIRKLTDSNCWRHIPGELNPADLPSRGATMEKYMKLRWWEGPEWLHGPVSAFPNSSPAVDEEAVFQEKKKTVVSALAQSTEPHFLDKLERVGDWHKLLRIVSYVMRFVKRVRKSTAPSSLIINEKEVEAAELIVIKHVQRSTYADQPPTDNLRTRKDEHGVLRVVTRLVDGDGDANFKYPVLLPGKHPLVRMLIYKEHSMASHAGIHYMMSITRQKYWILRTRSSIKAVINKCPICRVHRAKRCQVVEAPLPLDRIKTTRCFAVTGVDLAGPLFLKDGQKVWIVLFTCAVYRAVHLELVTSLSSDAFLVALRKFVVRRGRPCTIYSDNGTNFVGVSNLFKKINWKDVDEYAAVTRIKWIHNPPTAAWWGGWWERLVGLMKELLRRVLGNRCVEYGELEVLVLEVEAVMNERPLTYVSEDPADLRPLTPSMFMRDLPVACLPEADVGERKLRKNWKHVEHLRDQLRTRFQKEYLAHLVHRGKVKRSDILNVGDVVLVELDNLKRFKWPIGIITEVYPGRGGDSRTARIRTATGQMLRPFQRLFPLEMAQAPAENWTKKEDKQECEEVGEDDNEEIKIPEELMDQDPEPVIITKSGRRVVKPSRLGYE